MGNSVGTWFRVIQKLSDVNYQGATYSVDFYYLRAIYKSLSFRISFVFKWADKRDEFREL